MSTSSRRRARLRAAKGLPAMRCPACDTPLERVFNADRHLARCAEALRRAEAAMVSRGAAE